MNAKIEYFEREKPLPRRVAGSLFCVLILFYLGFHTVSGERGVFALLREKARLGQLQTQLVEVKEKRQELEKKVANLRSDNLDLDLLDEQARKVLGTTGKGEVVLFLGNKQESGK